MYLIFFLCGILAAHFQWKPSAAQITATLLASVAYLIIMVALPSTRSVLLPISHSPMQYWGTAGNLVLGVLLLPYALATVRVPSGKRFGLLGSIDRHLSNLTYEVYLLHWAALSVINNIEILRFGRVDHLRGLPFTLVGYVAIAAGAIAVYLWFDRPIDGLRRRFVKSQMLRTGEAEGVEDRIVPGLLPERVPARGGTT